MPRVIYLVHTSHGRTRLRLPCLRRDANLATPLAEGLQQVRGVEEVEVRPFTGSVLCVHDPYELSVDALLEEVRRLSGITTVVRPGEETPEEETELLRALEEGSGIARAASQFFKGVNVDVLRASEGRADLGTLAALGFAVAGAAEVVRTRKLPFPPWFNLAWWAFRTFATVETTAISHTESPVRPNGHEASTEPGATGVPEYDA
jgi:hypothetical protein